MCASVFQHQHAVGILQCLVQVVYYGNYGEIFAGKLFRQLKSLVLVQKIHSGGGFVQ
ncbi:hypothetical protein D3C87_2064370 [compost metagenome]